MTASVIRLLLLEDNPGDAVLIREALRESSATTYEILWAERLSTALQKIQSSAPDLILADLGLPDSAGLATIRRLRAAAPDLAIVVMTGNDDEQIGLEVIKSGAQDYIVKGQNDIEYLPRVLRYAIERQQSAVKLQEVEERFERLASNAPDIIFRYEIQPQMRLSYINPAVETITGYSPEFCYADPQFMFRVIFPDDAEKLATLINQRTVPDEPVLIRWVGKDDVVRWMETRFVSVKDAAGELIAVEGITRDITRQRNLENSYQQLFNEMQDAFALHEIILDDAGVPVDYRFLAVNPSFERITGYKSSDVVGKFVTEVMPDTEKVWIERYGQVALTGQPATFEQYAPSVDRYFYITAYCPEYGQFACTFMDVTERKRAEKALQESEARYRLISEVASDYMFSSRVEEDGTVVQNWLAGATERITGYLNEEFLATGGWRAHLHPDDLAIDDHDMEKLHQNQPVDSELRMLRKDGSVAWVQVLGVPIWSDEHNRLTGIYGSVRNITERKQAEIALRESEGRFKTLFNQAPLGMALTDSITGHYFTLNQRFAEIAGRPIEEMKTIDWMQFTHPDDLQLDLDQMKQLLAGKIDGFQMEKRFVHPDGKIVWVNMTIAPVDIGQADHLHHLCMVEDITDRKTAEAALRDSEDSLHALIDAVDHSLFLIELDGTVVSINETAAHRVNFHPTEMVGKDLISFVVPDAQNLYRGYAQQAIDSKQTIRFIDHRAGIWSDNSIFPVLDENGEVWRLAIYGQDITQQKQSEENLLNSEKKFRSLFENNHAVMLMIEPATGKILDANEAACSFYGGSHEELLTKSIFEINTLPENQVREEMRVALSENKNYFQFQHRLASGRIRDVEVYSVPIQDKGKPFLYSIIHDVTERNQAQAALQDSEDSLHALIDAVDHSLFLIELDGTVVSINETTAQRMKSTSAEMIGKDIYTYVEADVAELRREYAKQAIESKQPVRFVDQRFGRWIDNSIYPVLDEKGEVWRLAIYGQDITERRQMEAALESRIIALTRPLDQAGDLDFQDLFDLEAIQRLQDEFSTATGVASVITNPDGIPITRPSNFTRLCYGIIRETEQGRINCYKSDAALGRFDHNGPTVQPCLSCGLWDAGASITVGGRHIANWLIGQVRDETQSEEQMRKYAREIGADEKSFLEAFREVPVMPQEQFKQVAQTVFTLASQLSNMAYQNVQQARFITEVKQAEEKVTAGLATLEAALSSMSDAVFISDAEGHFIHFNQAFATFHKFENKEDCPLNLIEWVKFIEISDLNKKIIPVEQWVVSRALRGESGVNQEFIVRRIDTGETYIGSYNFAPIWNNDHEIVGSVVTARDITKRKQVEQELRESEALLNKIYDLLPVGLWFADKDGKLLRGNPAGVKIWGAEPHVSPAEYGVFKARSLPSGEEIAPEDWALAHTINEGVTIYNELLEIDAFDGEKRIILNSTAPVLDENGDIQGAIVVNQDVTEKEKVNKLLRESEERNRMIVSSATEAIILQFKTGEIVSWNEAAERIFGISKDEVLGINATERHWETYREDGSHLSVEEHPSMITFASGEPCHDVIMKVVRDDESYSWVSIDTNPVFFNDPSNGPDAVVITVQDITKRHQAQENLRERERELSALMDNLPGMAYRCDNDQNWTMRFVSQGSFDLTGYQPEELINNKKISYNSLIHPDDREWIWQEIQIALAQSQSFVLEYRIINAAGVERWMWERGSAVFGEKGEIKALEGFITDITERKQASNALQESEARFRTLYEQSPGPYQSLNEQGVILEVNRAWLEELGYQSDEVIGHWFGDFLSGTDCELFPQRFEFFKSQGEVHGVEFEMLRKDGSSIQVSFEGKIMRDQQGSFVQTHCVFTNITERKRVEDQLLQYAEDLNKAQLVANVGSWKWTIPTNQLEWSDTMYTIFGMDKDTFTGDLGTVLAQAIHPDDREAVEASNQSVMQEGKPIPLEYRVVRPNGEVRTVWAEAGELVFDADGNPQELTGIVQDITDRKMIEARLLLQDAALMAAANGIVITDLDANIEWANPAFCQMTGFTLDEAIGKNPNELVKSGLHEPAYYAEMWETILAGKVWRGEFINRRKDGTLYNEHEIITPILNSTGKITSFIAIKEDISLRKQQEQHLLRQTHIQEQLVAMGRALGSTIDVNMIYRIAYRYVREIINVPNMGITLFDRDDKRLHTVFSIGNRDILDIRPLLALALESSDRSDYSEAIATSHPIILNDLMKTAGERNIITLGEPEDFPKSAIYVPMIAEGKPIGVLDLQSYQKDVFTDETGEWLSMVANQVALAIQNARLYGQIRKRVAQLSGLREIDASINAHRSLETTFQLILNQVRYHLGIDAADILSLDDGDQELVYQAGYGFDAYQVEEIAVPYGCGLAGTVAKSGKMVQHLGSDQYDQVLAECQKWTSENFSAYIGLPVRINEKVIGVMEVFHRSSLSPHPEWLQYLETLAGQVAIAIENSELFNDLQDTAEDLLQAYDATIEGWSQAMDLRDHETEGHTQRVTTLTVKVAEEMGLSKEKLIHIRRGALLHDIGKLGVPDHILLKPGPLTPEEWEIMKRHPDYAFGMLRDIEYLQPAIEIPYFHHEKWDGSGYPFGLQGNVIPLPARIFAVVDVWDAVTNDRPYHDAWSVKQALEHIKSERGKHFDPDVVDVFMRVIQQQQGESK